MEEWKNKLPFNILIYVEERGQCELMQAAKVADAFALLWDLLVVGIVAQSTLLGLILGKVLEAWVVGRPDFPQISITIRTVRSLDIQYKIADILTVNLLKLKIHLGLPNPTLDLKS